MRDRPEVSYTELEHETAEQQGIPRLVFLLGEDTEGPVAMFGDLEYGARQQAFRRRLAASGVTTATVTSPGGLETALLHALNALPRLEQPGSHTDSAHHRLLAVQSVAPASVTVLRALPRDTAAFTCRDDELAQLVRAAMQASETERAVIVHAINGMPGVGKTAFAVHAAHILADKFPDGQLFVRLHAHTPGHRPVDPAAALASLLVAVGVSAQAIPADPDARAAMWRDRLVGKRLLIVLDDAAGHEQVEPLLPAAGGTLVLVTSRRRLAALEAAETLPLDTLSTAKAAELFTRLAGRDPGRATEDVAKLVRLCGHLPLALALLAARLRHHPSWTVADLVAKMERGQDRIAQLQAEDVTVGTAFDLSYRELPAERQRVFRRMGLHPGTELDGNAAAVLSGVSPQQVYSHLDALYNDRLLDEPVAGRYRMHDLIRDYATRVAATEETASVRRASVTRLLDYYQETAAAATVTVGLGNPPDPPAETASAGAEPLVTNPSAARAWLDSERANLVAVVVHAAGHGWPGHCISLAATLSRYLEIGGHYADAATVHSHALQAARQAADRHAEADALNNLGVVSWLQGRYEQASSEFEQALAYFQQLGDRAEEARVLGYLAAVGWRQGHYEHATGQFQQSLALYRQIGDRAGEAATLNSLGLLGQRQGRYQEAIIQLRQALALFHQVGDRAGEADALNHLGLAYQRQGKVERAVDHQRRSLSLFQEIGDRAGEADALTHLGVAYQRQGELERAVDHQRRGLSLFQEIGDRAGEADALTHLGVAYQQQGQLERAVEHHSRGLALFQQIGDRAGEAEALNCLADALRASGSMEKARSLHANALAVARDIGDLGEQAGAHNGLGDIHRTTGNLDLARNHWLQALAAYRDLGAPTADAVEAKLAALPPPRG